MTFELGAVIAKRFRLLRRLLVDVWGAVYLALDGRSGAQVWLRVVSASALATARGSGSETLPGADVATLSAIGGPLPRLLEFGPLASGSAYVVEGVVATDRELVRDERPLVGERFFLRLVDALDNFWRRGLAHGCLSEAHIATTPTGMALRFGVPWALAAPTADGTALTRLVEMYAPETPRTFAILTLGTELANGAAREEAVPEFYRRIRSLAPAKRDGTPNLLTTQPANESAGRV